MCVCETSGIPLHKAEHKAEHQSALRLVRLTPTCRSAASADVATCGVIRDSLERGVPRTRLSTRYPKPNGCLPAPSRRGSTLPCSCNRFCTTPRATSRQVAIATPMHQGEEGAGMLQQLTCSFFTTVV